MKTSRTPAVVAALALLVAVMALAGCGSDSSTQGSTETTTASAAETTDEGETATAETRETEAATTHEDEEASATETSESEPSTTGSGTAAKEIEIVVVGAAPQGGIKRATVKQGDKVVLVVKSDVADEIHLHGYDIMKDVSAGGTARITFVASIPGRFEAELEDRGVQIADVTVSP
jgi:hypothetical protein